MARLFQGEASSSHPLVCSRRCRCLPDFTLSVRGGVCHFLDSCSCRSLNVLLGLSRPLQSLDKSRWSCLPSCTSLSFLRIPRLNESKHFLLEILIIPVQVLQYARLPSTNKIVDSGQGLGQV